MPRQARLDAPETLYHVMGRGIEGTKIFKFIQKQRYFRYFILINEEPVIIGENTYPGRI